MIESFANTPFEFFFQLGLSIILGSIIGAERRMAHKSVGIRTFSLVALGSTLFTLISLHGFKYADVEPTYLIGTIDPSRITSQIVSGVGFIGAGIIFFTRSQPRGVTTAAGLWIAAAIGMAIGFRMYAIALVSSVLTVIIFSVLIILEDRASKIKKRSFFRHFWFK